jgi:hypothetical protein
MLRECPKLQKKSGVNFNTQSSLRVRIVFKLHSATWGFLPVLLTGCGDGALFVEDAACEESFDDAPRKVRLVFDNETSTSETIYFKDVDGDGAVENVYGELGIIGQGFAVRSFEVSNLTASLSVGGLPDFVEDDAYEIGTASTDVILELDFISTTDASTARLVRVLDQFRGDLTVNDSETLVIYLDAATLKLGWLAGDLLESVVLQGSARETVQIVDLDGFGQTGGFATFDANALGEAAGVEVEFERPESSISVTMSDGNDTFTIYGNFAESDYMDTSVQARANGDVSVVQHIVSGMLDFGEGIDTLVTYGAIDLTGVTSFSGLENFTANSNVRLPGALFLSITGLTFNGAEAHNLELVVSNQAQLDAVLEKLETDPAALQFSNGALLNAVLFTPSPNMSSDIVLNAPIRMNLPGSCSREIFLNVMESAGRATDTNGDGIVDRFVSVMQTDTDGDGTPDQIVTVTVTDTDGDGRLYTLAKGSSSARVADVNKRAALRLFDTMK